MRRISHRVRCSGVMHTVWRDTDGVLHRTCNGEGCTFGFEKARALLSGLPDVPAGTGWRSRYAARKWGEDWQDAKRAGWRKRAVRHRTRGEKLLSGSEHLQELAVDADFDSDLFGGPPASPLLDVLKAGETKEAIRKRLSQAIYDDLQEIAYRRPSVSASSCGTSAGVISTYAHIDRNAAAVVSAEVELTRMPSSCGLPRTLRRCILRLSSTAEQAFRVRTALGGSSLFYSGTDAFIAAAILEKRADGLVVVAGRQGRGLSVESTPALVRREGARAVLTRWMGWEELDEDRVEPYARELSRKHPISDVHAACCILAVRGRPKFAPVIHGMLDYTGVSWRGLKSEEESVRIEEAALPPKEMLDNAVEQCRLAAIAYVEKWGVLVGCTRACSLFDPQLFRSVCNVRECPIEKPFLTAKLAVCEWERVHQRLKAVTEDIRNANRYLRSCGFRMTKEGQLEEIGRGRKTRTGDGQQKRRTREALPGSESKTGRADH
jgi:hypothetical protein